MQPDTVTRGIRENYLPSVVSEITLYNGFTCVAIGENS